MPSIGRYQNHATKTSFQGQATSPHTCMWYPWIPCSSKTRAFFEFWRRIAVMQLVFATGYSSGASPFPSPTIYICNAPNVSPPNSGFLHRPLPNLSSRPALRMHFSANTRNIKWITNIPGEKVLRRTPDAQQCPQAVSDAGVHGNQRSLLQDNRGLSVVNEWVLAITKGLDLQVHQKVATNGLYVVVLLRTLCLLFSLHLLCFMFFFLFFLRTAEC